MKAGSSRINPRFRALLCAAVAVAVLVLLIIPPLSYDTAQANPGDVALVSASSSGSQGDDVSYRPAVSADGRYIAFESKSSEMVVPNTTFNQIFRKDLQTGQLVLVSCNASGTQGNDNSSFCDISGDGRYVAFESQATNLVSPATSGTQIFRKDLQTGEVRLVSCTSGGIQGNYQSESTSISSDGRYVAFDSDATNLVGGDTNTAPDIFRKDLQTGVITLCSCNGSGVQADSSSFVPAINADGRYVAFESDAANLVSPATSSRQVFRKDLQTGQVKLASCTEAGTQGDLDSWWTCISGDGRFVVFTSVTTNLVPLSPVFAQILRKDLQTGEIERASCDAAGAPPNNKSNDSSLSSDGRFVTFESYATNLVAGSTAYSTIYRKDMRTGAVERCSSNAAGTAADGSSTNADISGDGRYTAFSSAASNLVTPMATGQQIYRKELTIPTTFLFAEGYTGDGFQEYLCLGQPADVPVDVTVTYMFKDGSAPKVETYGVQARSRLTLNVNAVVGAGKDVSMKCEAASPFIAERPMYFDYNGRWTGGHDVVGAPETSTAWYFAEGYTGTGFDEWICVLNPGDAPAELKFRFQTQEEGEKVVSGLSVPARSRGSFKANDLLGGKSYQTSLKLESSQPVVAERPMYFDYMGTGGWHWTGGHCVMGAPDLASDYYFAEGTTRAGFEEWLTLQNPGSAPITVHAVYYLREGAPVEKDYAIEPSKRFTILVNGPDGVGTDKDVSVYLSSSSLFLAERPMYFNYQGLGAWGWTGGHCVIGSARSAREFYFAEGYTGAGFEEWLCIQNPGASDAVIAITYYPEGGGAPILREHTMAANSRYTVPVNADAGSGLSISAKVASNRPVIVERPMYFDFQGKWTGGHDVVGYAP